MNKPSIFDEQYRVVSVAEDAIVIEGVLTGNVLTIVKPASNNPIVTDDFPPGKLIALSDPSHEPQN